MVPRLNEKQADLLRYLYRQSGPVPVAHLDGRVVRALKSRELVDERDGWVSVNEAGRTAFERKDQVVRRRRKRGTTPADVAARQARAQAISRAVESLELALPKDAEVVVGAMFAYADDVVEALRAYARRLESGPR